MSPFENILAARRSIEAARMHVTQVAVSQERLTQNFVEQIRGFESEISNYSKLISEYQIAIASVRRPAISSIALPSFRVSQSLADMLTHANPQFNIPPLQQLSNLHEIARLERITTLQSRLSNVYAVSAISSLQTVDLNTFGLKLGLDQIARQGLADSHASFAAQYAGFYEGLTQSETDFVDTAQALIELPAVEYMNQTALIASTSSDRTQGEENNAIAQIRSDYASEASDQLEQLLNKLNPDFMDLLSGARAAIKSQHPDYVRHSATSYRELFTHVTHLLAPDDRLEDWTKDPADFHNKRPTRRARLRYITRNLQLTFGGFLNADVASALSFLDIFQKGTHALKPDFSPAEVLDFTTRMEGLLRFLLVVDECTR